ncbi:glycine betaine ABC transporter substrate-binding protein [Acetobacteraceae bacterium ESL0709]|nr:glycine betaine ABC transporter substrate-binding protein [Acetobacteraceae bacterium ESL0697]MDF7678200.1 glycine betaine ABC transporter substrate-binding protein [Acetobacteraceae bacterium ESL0709]
MSHLSIGHLYTALHGACASAVARIIEAHGVDVSYVDLAMEDRQEALETAEIDLLVSAWMPRDSNVLVEGGEVFGDIYRPQAAFAALTGKKIPSGWMGKEFSRIIASEEAQELVQSARVARSDLGALPLEILGDAALFGHVQKASQDGDNPLIIAWQPHAVFHTDWLQMLPDDAGLLGGELKAQFVLRSGVRQQMDDDLYDELAGMMLGNRVMSALDYAVSVDGLDPESAAESWQRGRLIGR